MLPSSPRNDPPNRGSVEFVELCDVVEIRNGLEDDPHCYNVAFGELAVPVEFTSVAASGARSVPDVLGVRYPSKVLDSVVLGVEVDVVTFVASGSEANESLKDEVMDHAAGDLSVDAHRDHQVPAFGVLERAENAPLHRVPSLIVSRSEDVAAQAAHSSEIGNLVIARKANNRSPLFRCILFGSHLASFVGQLVRAAGRATVSRSSFYFREILPC